VRLGRYRRFREEAIEEWLARLEHGGPDAPELLIRRRAARAREVTGTRQPIMRGSRPRD
jgi:hypothetical protein